MGNNLFNLPHAKWTNRRRAIQPLFAKKHVASFADHIGGAADTLANSWLSRELSMPTARSANSP